MYKVSVNESSMFEVNRQGDNISINGNSTSYELTKLSENHYLLVKNNKVYNIDVVGTEASQKSIKLKVNGKYFDVGLKDQLDLLLDKLGIGNMAAAKVSEVKAPMPGLILDVKAKSGETVKKGDPLLILEAMKMENVIKSPVDGTISKLLVQKGTSVEKNQILIQF